MGAVAEPAFGGDFPDALGAVEQDAAGIGKVQIHLIFTRGKSHHRLEPDIKSKRPVKYMSGAFRTKADRKLKNYF